MVTSKIENYESSSLELAERLQLLLDKQWEGLSQRKAHRLGRARSGIANTMGQLADIKKILADLYQEELDIRRDSLSKETLIKQETYELNTEIERIQGSSKEAQNLEKKERELQSVSKNIQDLEIQLKSLYIKKKDLQCQRQDAQSIIESRVALVEAKIDDLKEDSIGPKQQEIFSHEADIYEDYQQSNVKEYLALKDGVVIWDDVCRLVKQLEHDLASQTQITDKQTLIKQPPDEKVIIELLNDAKKKLKNHLDFSNQRNWRLLAVAIMHEITALDQGIDLVSNHLMTASLSDLRHTTS